MEINRAKFANGDRNELLRLARTIRKSAPTDKNAHPMASQFFDADPSSDRPINTSALLENSAGAENVDHFRWIEALSSAGYAGIALSRPSKTADVRQIGMGGSGWNAPKPSVNSGAKAVLAGKLEKALHALPESARAVLEKAAAPSSATADTNVLVENLKSIVFQLLGVSAESLDPATLKVKLGQAIKSARPDIQRRLQKALGIGSEPDTPNVSLAELIALGAKVENQGSRLHISV
jgi:hypothetical protein